MRIPLLDWNIESLSALSSLLMLKCQAFFRQNQVWVVIVSGLDIIKKYLNKNDHGIFS